MKNLLSWLVVRRIVPHKVKPMPGVHNWFHADRVQVRFFGRFHFE